LRNFYKHKNTKALSEMLFTNSQYLIITTAKGVQTILIMIIRQLFFIFWWNWLCLMGTYQVPKFLLFPLGESKIHCGLWRQNCMCTFFFADWVIVLSLNYYFSLESLCCRDKLSSEKKACPLTHGLPYKSCTLMLKCAHVKTGSKTWTSTWSVQHRLRHATGGIWLGRPMPYSSHHVPVLHR